MHSEARAFLDFVYDQCPAFFHGCRALDVGSADINGNNRRYFTAACEYHGNDVLPGPNVTVVARTGDLQFEPASFDVVLSSECFEHDMHYAQSLQKVVQLLKPGGLLAFTCASTGRAEHGTLRTTPSESLTSKVNNEAWANYYKNLTDQDVMDAVPIDNVFRSYAFYYNPSSKDLYFAGIKDGGDQPKSRLPCYSAHCTSVQLGAHRFQE